MKKYTYNVGLYYGRKITVETNKGEQHAYSLACSKLDDIYAEHEIEAPVAWTLVLVAEN